MTERPAPVGQLQRRLTAFDGTLITIGSVIGTGIFLTPSDMAGQMSHAGLLQLTWVVGGMLALAGALTYAELGTMFPRAGGIYVFLKEAYGPLWGFLYGWTAFLVIMAGGIAAISTGFGKYFGEWVPWFSADHMLTSASVGDWTWTLHGSQVAAVLAIAVITAINHVGLRSGAWAQNGLTILKVGSILAFLVGGALVAAKVDPQFLAPLSTALPPGAVDGGAGGGMAGALLGAFALAMISTLWSFDGWYGLTFSAGEMKRPERSLPIGLIVGTATVATLYFLMNWVYLRALSLPDIASSEVVGQDAAAALFGTQVGNAFSLAIIVSSFGCLAATILYSSRIYQPMAADGVFFRSLARIDPKHHVPVRSLWMQSAWATVLTLSGRYDQLYTYVVFASMLFMAATGLALFRLRKTRPDHPRPYRVWGYPVVPLLFVVSATTIMVSTMIERPTEPLIGLGIVALGLPAYAWWRRDAARTARDARG
jgi:basic amino acid/polyamine antiporter, APA family